MVTKTKIKVETKWTPVDQRITEKTPAHEFNVIYLYYQKQYDKFSEKWEDLYELIWRKQQKSENNICKYYSKGN